MRPADRGSSSEAFARSAVATRRLSVCLECDSRNHFRLHQLLDDLAVDAADVIDVGLRARGDDALDFVVFEVNAGVVVAGVARLHLAGSDQLLIQRASIFFTVVVRRVAALEEAEALYRGER